MNSRFRFQDAAAIVDYLHAIGISDCYASSYLAAVPGSPHGYDVVDPTRLNPEIGSDEDYWAWMGAIRSHGMGHVLDLVPNHMGIAKSANPWWQDVLENGPSSRFAQFFDIEWQPVKAELADKVLIPILGDQYGAVLERGELQLEFASGAFAVRYYDNVLPIAPDTYAIIFRDALDSWLTAHPGDAADELQSVLTAVSYLPPRHSRDAEAISVRAREKEVVKRRLTALVEQSGEVQTLIRSCVRTMNGVRSQPRSFDRLDELLNMQSYRLAYWRVASEEINYRRFFDVNQLAALRMEDPAVFDEVNRFVFDLVRQGAATGFRVDHVDGLFAPADYLRRLQARCAQETADEGPIYVVVEKILGVGEQLPGRWPVNGTTGYEFASVVNNLFVDGRNARAMEEIYRRFVADRREHASFDDLAYRSKKQVLHETMSGDINSLGHQLNRFSERNRHFRDFTLYSLISTIKEVIACFPVYRTYVTAEEPVNDHDRTYITEAIRRAKTRAGGVAHVVFDFIERLLLKQTGARSQEECEERERFIGKFQQITSPVAAKGIEDTALYVYNRLLSLNDVGSDPRVFGLEPAAVHGWMASRRHWWPSALSATSTHDSKRGEDVRARLNVLSEVPGAWKAAVRRWRVNNRRFKSEIDGAPVPDGNDEYFIYQTLVGAWPFGTMDSTALTAFRERIAAYLRKALREAKVHTDWLSPHEAYEEAVLRFVDAILDRRRAARFLGAFEPFQAKLAEAAIYNSLAQLTIKITAPGVPDFYQGTEFWDLNLVDPDNRRPVDYHRRRQALAEIQSASIADLLEHRGDGRVKLLVMTRALAARAAMRELYEEGDYVPIETAGSRRDSLFAFARCHANRVAITCVPRMIAPIVFDRMAPPVGPELWSDTRIELRSAMLSGSQALPTFRNAITGDTVLAERVGNVVAISAGSLFARFPVALLVPDAAGDRA
jgi:(1->4)-alpha-D-glucan 1-alpha-D-glucosylmutase